MIPIHNLHGLNLKLLQCHYLINLRIISFISLLISWRYNKSWLLNNLCKILTIHWTQIVKKKSCSQQLTNSPPLHPNFLLIQTLAMWTIFEHKGHEEKSLYGGGRCSLCLTLLRQMNHFWCLLPIIFNTYCFVFTWFNLSHFKYSITLISLQAETRTSKAKIIYRFLTLYIIHLCILYVNPKVF